MAAENMSLVPIQRLNSGLNAAQLLFHDDANNAQALRFGGGGAAPQHRAIAVGEPCGPKTRELSGFMDEKLLTSVDREHYLASQGAAAASTEGEFRRSVYAGNVQERRGVVTSRNWNGNGETSTDSNGDESEGEEDEDEDDEPEEVDEGDKLIKNHSKDRPSFGQPGSTVNRANTSESNQQRRIGHFPNEITVAEHDGDMCYAQFMQGSEGQGYGRKDVAGDNGCGFSGRKDSSTSSDPGESLRAIFSDPITGTLMDDAMILSCGHSFGGGGIQQVVRMKLCYTCSQPVTQDSVSPNLSLRAAVQAFRREEEQMYRANKRRRERFDQVKHNCTDSAFMEAHRARGVQFPFVVTDRVIIKGNKRTPERFVGREAIVTKQCLNGWYVVKTLDNAESVKLQYRSLAKISDNSNTFSDRVKPNWL
ncbi:hypothetical protein V2J09_017516 [Rumex salicifolius]